MCILEAAWQEGIHTSVKEPQIDTQHCRMEKTAGNCHSDRQGYLCHCFALVLWVKLL